MKKIFSFLIAILAVTSLWAQSGQVSLTGQIASKQNNRGIAGAMVTLGNQDISTITNADGRFTFIGLQAGDEELIIEADGHKATVELIQLQAG